MNILMVIPARSGSKRLPGKNIQPLGGRPLLLWTLDAALRAVQELDKWRHSSRMIVSTDSEEYRSIVNNYADWTSLPPAPFLRPPEISGDVDTAFVVKHAAEWAQTEWGFVADYMVTLQPTSPFRSAEDILTGVYYAVEAHINNRKLDCVFSAKRVTEYPEWMWTQEKDDNAFKEVFAKPFMKPERSLSGVIAQDIPVRYIPNGAVYVTSREMIMRGQIYGQRGRDKLYEMPALRSLDIEEQGDLDLARYYLREGLVK